ncbi:MAG: hypothetical protein KatS3mg105_0312 [Gemmatales bacterium]|nr:MAG: hypothetical protein KatS3mg105_0312 [Gemmatales bacterium]
MDINGSFQHYCIFAHSSIHQLAACKRPARLPKQTFQKAEFGRCQIEDSAVSGRLMPNPVDANAKMFNDVAGIGSRFQTPPKRLDPL